MRKLAVVLTVVALLGLLAPAAHAAPFCGIRWGSLGKTSPRATTAPIVEARAGQHRCYDRLVYEVDGRAPGYRVGYVDAVRAQGTGAVVPLRGGAFLSVTLAAPGHDMDYKPTYHFSDRRELLPVGRFRTFRQIAWGGSFEGSTTIGLGVRARLPFRAFTLDGPGSHDRLVIDVAHRW